jgi:acyl-CoA synthetase (AMP-forming)/AMP-acid ligase II
MRGLMQEVPLTIELVLARLARHTGPRQVVTGTQGESIRFTWEQIPRTAVGKYDKKLLRKRYRRRATSAA